MPSSLASSSGCPHRTTCSNFSLEACRLSKERISSSRSMVSNCASSITSTATPFLRRGDFRQHLQQRFQPPLSVRGIAGDLELVEHRLQKLIARQGGMDNHRGANLVLNRGTHAHQVKRRVEQGGLAGADAAGQQDQAFTVENAAGKPAQRFMRVPCAMEKAGIRCKTEGVFAEREIVLARRRTARQRPNPKGHPGA